MQKKRSAKDNSVQVIGRHTELGLIQTLLKLERNILIEGPVGVGKTFLMQQVLRMADLKFERVDGDTRYTEQKLTGWYDPPIVLKKGYVASAFVEGPLAISMRQGKVLFINELNRMPEAVQNILLPAMDERRIILPKLGEIVARPGFIVVATQNPKEFTATHALSEALLDRFEMIRLDYQSREEEQAILARRHGSLPEKKGEEIISRAIDLTRATRSHPLIKRGASVRAALAILSLVEGGMDFETAALVSLPSRIEMISSDENPEMVIRELLESSVFPELTEKKKEVRL